MMGRKTYQEKLFYNFSLNNRVPENHFLRRLDKILDLQFVRQFVGQRYSHTGQPSIDPQVIFKMMLIGYLYGITSERRLADDISLNLAYMWYLGYDLDESTPDHSVISKARSRYGKEVFERFFQEILQQCVQAGLVKGDKIFADSTIIRANASMKSIQLRSEAVEPRFGVKEFIDKVFTENPVAEEKPTEDAPPKEDPRKGSGNDRILSNKTHVSRTDPDASIISHGRKLPTQLAYKEHFTVDGHGRVITAVEVTPAAVGDEAVLSRLLEQQPVPVKELGADSKYGTFDNYAWLFDHGILPSIPPWNQNVPSRLGHYEQREFQYNSATDTYTCPDGKPLKRSQDPIRNNRWTYYAKKKDCRICPVRSKCISPTLQKRRIFRHIFHEARDKALRYLSTDQSKVTQKQRKIYAEWVNAESKTRHGLRRAMFRGLNNMTIQVLMTASTQNIKRLIKHCGNTSGNFKERVFTLFFRLGPSFLRPSAAFC